MTISALMAVYNREDTVEEAIESIASQLSNEDELIISNDESTDNTLLICKEMQKKYPFIQIIEHHRTNVDDHMFFLIDKATKDISVICDSDDISEPNRISEVKNIYQAHPEIKCVYHNARIINERNVITSDDFFDSFAQIDNLFHMFLKSTFFGACMTFNTTFAKKIIEKRTKNRLSWDKVVGFGMKRNKVILFEKNLKLLKYRRWSDNISVKNRPIYDKIKEKIITFFFYIKVKIK